MQNMNALPNWNIRKYTHLLNINNHLSNSYVAQHNRELVMGGHIHVPMTYSGTFDYILSNKINSHNKIPAEILLIPETTDMAISQLYNTGQIRKIAALNFANCRGTCGGYLHGSRAQEEDLARVIPGLYASLSQSSYPFDFYNELKYTPDLEIARLSDDNYNVYRKSCWATCSIITAAAPDLRFGSYDKWDGNKMDRLIDCIFLAPLIYDSNVDTLVLGAFGSGVFQNDPKLTSKIMLSKIEKYRHLYKYIVFAIPDKTSVNYKTYEMRLLPHLMKK